MINVLLIFLVCSVIFYFYHKTYVGIYVYIISVFLAPYCSIGSLNFRIELLLTPILFVIFLLRKRRVYITKIILLWLLIVIYLFLVTFISNDYDLDSEVSYTTGFNFIRYGFLMIIASNLKTERISNIKMLRLLLLVSVPISLIGIGQSIQNSYIISLTEKFYSSVNRPVFQGLMEEISKHSDYIFRSIGVFENVSYYAAFLLITTFVSLEFILRFYKYNISLKERKILIGIFLLNVTSGILCSSLTYYGGVFFIFLYFLVFDFKVMFKYVILLVIAIIFLLLYLKIKYSDTFSVYADNFNYLIDAFFNGRKLGQRYDFNERSTGDLTKIIYDNFLLGSGFRSYKNLGVNDSLYLEFFYSAGLIGSILLTIFGIWISKIIFTVHYNNRYFFSMILILFLLSGLGCNSVSIIRFSEWFWMFIGLLMIDLKETKVSLFNPN